MARKPLRPLIRSGGFYPSRKWTPLVYAGGYTTANGGEEPAPPPIGKTVTGNPIHITDALAKPVQALSVKLEPIQDLHGYDNPWPAGGGKNKFNGAAVTTTHTGNWGVSWDEATQKLTIEHKNTYYTGAPTLGLSLPVGTYTVKCASATGAFQINKDGQYLIQCDATARQFTVEEGSVYTALFYNANASTFVFEKIQIEAGSTATSYAPYSNICPISGHTDADVTRTGKNLLPTGLSPTATGSATVTPTQSGGYVLKATAAYGWLWGRINVLQAKPFAGKRLIFGFDISIDHDQNPQTIFALRNSDGIVTSKTVSYSASRSSAYLDIPADVTDDHFITMTLYVTTSVSASVGWETTYSNLQIEIVGASETAPTAYSPYVGTTYPIPLGQTVYGGTLDVLTGVLTVDRAYAVYDGSSDEDWVIIAASNRAYIAVSDIKTPATDRDVVGIVANLYKEKPYYTAPSYMPAMTARANITQINVFDERIDSKATWQTILAANPLQVVYPLETPATIQLTPTQIELLLGENNLLSDGEMTLTYLADGNASDEEALNILLGGRYVNNHTEDEPTDREALDIVLGGKK